MEQKKAVLSVKRLSISFTQYERGVRQVQLSAIRDLDLTVREGELVAVVGASGSGKSLLAHAVLGLLPVNAKVGGTITYQGNPLTAKLLKQVRGREIVLVPQNVSNLDPLMKIGSQLRRGSRRTEERRKSVEALGRYGLGPETEELYPFELSGGMVRRVLIASAVMEEPRLVIADEPTPGLHIEAARRVLSHFQEMTEMGAGVLLITHDLELALTCADRIVVFHEGRAVDEVSASDFSEEAYLKHPYTKALYRAIPCHNSAWGGGVPNA